MGSSDCCYRMDQYKEASFCPRLTVYHETLCPLGSATRDRPVIAGLWHDAVAGRQSDEVASVILRLLQDPSVSQAEEMVLWLDNCGGQNKNYTLVTALHCAMQSGELPFQTLTLKYFVAGHSYMSADSFHSKVEGQFKHMKNVLNFADIVVSQNKYSMCIKYTSKQHRCYNACQD